MDLIRSLLCAMLAVPLGMNAGCGSGSSSPTKLGNASILTQPQDQSVPMGLSATFTVIASGASLQYQWMKNGSPIAGATASTYTTPTAAFSDSGSLFMVTVSNSTGSLMSDTASLLVTARAPKPGDLRFGPVDAPTTINGYQLSGDANPPQFCLAPGQGGITIITFTTGTPYYLGNNPCLMKYETFALPSTVTGLETIYSVWPIGGFPAVLSDPAVWAPSPPPTAGSSVLQSLWLTSTTAGYSFTYSKNATGFSGASYVVPLAALQAAATQEAQRGRVITAISSDGNQATYWSYAWSGDPSTLYESKVVFATLSSTVAAVTSLANQGYILTASGGTQAADGSGVVLVGTRVKGDVMPRPINVGVFTATSDSSPATMKLGYAIVAVVQLYDASGSLSYQFIGER